jgi:dihydrofolate reductase
MTVKISNVSLIVATDINNGIGMNGKLPWCLKEDMKFFKKVTTGNGKNSIIMGRKTFESFPYRKALPNRLNIVLSSNPSLSLDDNVIVTNSLTSAINKISSHCESIFIIGGASVFSEALAYCSKIYWTMIDNEFTCDVFFPKIDMQKEGFRLLSVEERLREVVGNVKFTENKINYEILIYERNK